MAGAGIQSLAKFRTQIFAADFCNPRRLEKALVKSLHIDALTY
jgi:hypothetical protein